MREKTTYKKFLENLNSYIKKDKDIFVIGIAGGSGSGKSHIARQIMKRLDGAKALNMDDYILEDEVSKTSNWDTPNIWDLDLLEEHLKMLHDGKEIEKPIYDFTTHLGGKFEKFTSAKILVVEGLYAFHEKLMDYVDLKIFIDADEKLRFKRRLKRDISKRGRTKEKVIKKWKESVQPTYLRYILPLKRKADLIIVNE